MLGVIFTIGRLLNTWGIIIFRFYYFCHTYIYNIVIFKSFYLIYIYYGRTAFDWRDSKYTILPIQHHDIYDMYLKAVPDVE